MAVPVMGQAEASPELSFGVIADPQYADQDPKGTRFYRESLGKLKRSIAELSKQSPEFVVTLGDVIDTGFESFGAIMPLYDGLKVPQRVVPGNHDFAVADEDKGRVLAALKLDKPYGSESRGGWRFIYLDGTEVALWRYSAKDSRTKEAKAMLKRLEQEKLPQAQSWNAGIGRKQMDWLKAELDASVAANQRVIIFNHYPVIPVNDSHNLWNAEELVALLDQYDCVAAYMNGHNHAGNYGEHHGCHYVNFKGMVETREQTAYAIVRCFDDRLEIEGYGLELNRKLI